MRLAKVVRVNESEMTLLTTWDEHPIDGWFWAEKFDGCRAFWDGEQFWTRGGNIIPAPKWILDEMPKGFQVDGEMWAGRGGFQAARVAVQNGRFTKAVKFVAFDAPQVCGSREKRIAACKSSLGGKFATAAKCGVVQDIEDANKIFADIAWNGGEGIVCYNPTVTTYEKGRTKNALRIKV